MVLLSRVAKEHVKVALSGDGGDEVFSGYYRYDYVPKLWRVLSWIPSGLRTGAVQSFQALPESLKEVILKTVRLYRPGYRQLEKFSRILESKDVWALYLKFLSQMSKPQRYLSGLSEDVSFFKESAQDLSSPSILENLQLMDFKHYLPDDLLVKSDRASMAVGLEVRAPLLNHRVLETAFSISPRLRMKGGEKKYLLKKVLAQYLDPVLFDRPKAGFAVPLGPWLRGPLRKWATELLHDPEVRRLDFVDFNRLDLAFDELVNGGANTQLEVWGFLQLFSWYRHNFTA